MRELLQAGADVNKPTVGGRDTALHLACYSRHGPAARYLVNRLGCAVSLAGEHGDTPLHAAVFRDEEYVLSARDVELVQLLVDAGADLTLRDEDGKTPAEAARAVHRSPGDERAAEVVAMEFHC